MIFPIKMSNNKERINGMFPIREDISGHFSNEYEVSNARTPPPNIPTVFTKKYEYSSSRVNLRIKIHPAHEDVIDIRRRISGYEIKPISPIFISVAGACEISSGK